MRTCLVFYRGGARFAVELNHVRRICALREVRTLSSPAEGVLGIVPDGNHIVPVIEAPLPAPRQTPVPVRIVLLNNGESPFGLHVESLEGPRMLRLERVSLENLFQNQPLLREVPEEAILGVVTQPHGVTGHFGSPGSERGHLHGRERTPERTNDRSGEVTVLLSPAFLYRTRLIAEEA